MCAAALDIIAVNLLNCPNDKHRPPRCHRELPPPCLCVAVAVPLSSREHMARQKKIDITPQLSGHNPPSPPLVFVSASAIVVATPSLTLSLCSLCLMEQHKC